MRLFIDTDVLLEFIAKKKSSLEDWSKINALELTGCAELWVAATSYGALRSALIDTLSDEDIHSVLRSTMSFLSVCSVDGPDVRFALDHSSLPFEAALTEACARKIQADFIITRTGELKLPRAIRRVTPRQLFEVLEAEQGIVFGLIDF